MPDTQPATAMEVAQTICLYRDSGDAHPGDCMYDAEIARVMDAYAAERIAEVSAEYRQFRDGWQSRGLTAMAERDAILAKLEAAEACTTCDGQPHASGSICICGGSGRRSDETLNLRQLAQATQGQLTAAEERVRVLSTWRARAINLHPELEGLDANVATAEGGKA